MQVVLAALFLTQETAWEVSVDVVIKAPPQEVFKYVKGNPDWEMGRLIIMLAYHLGSG